MLIRIVEQRDAYRLKTSIAKSAKVVDAEDINRRLELKSRCGKDKEWLTIEIDAAALKRGAKDLDETSRLAVVVLAAALCRSTRGLNSSYIATRWKERRVEDLINSIRCAPAQSRPHEISRFDDVAIGVAQPPDKLYGRQMMSGGRL